MKKLSIVLIFALLTLGLCTVTFAAGSSHTCTPPVTVGGFGDSYTVTVTCSWVGDSSTGAVPSAVTGIPVGLYPYEIKIMPGSPAPTGYSMTVTVLVGSTAIDLMGGGGTGISATAGSQQWLTCGGKGYERTISAVTGNVTNTVNNAQGSYIIIAVPK